MPTLRVPTLRTKSIATGGGSNATVNAPVHPLLLVRDGAGKLAVSRGAPFQMTDVTPPTVSGYAVEQVAGSYTFRPNGTVHDNAAGNLAVYHFLTDAELTAEEALALIGDAAQLSNVGQFALSDYAAASNLALAALPGLATSRVGAVVTGATPSGAKTVASWSEISDATPSCVPTLVVRDNFNRFSVLRLPARSAVDHSAPPFTAFNEPVVAGTTIQASWTTASATDGRGATQMWLSIYTAEQTGVTAAQVAAGAGSGLVATASVSDAGTVTAHSFTGLTEGASYHVYGTASDAAGNFSAVAHFSAVTPTPSLNGFSAYWRYPSAGGLASETGAGGAFDGAGTKYAWYNSGNGATYYGINVAASPSALQTTTCAPVAASTTNGFTASVRIVPANASSTACGYAVVLYDASNAVVGTLEFVTGESARYVRVMDSAGAQLARQDITDASAFYNVGWYNYYIYAYYNYYVRLVPVAGSPGTYDCVFNVHYNNNGTFNFSYTYRASFGGLAKAAIKLFNQGSANMYVYNPWVYSRALLDTEVLKMSRWNLDPTVINFSGTVTGTRNALQALDSSAMAFGNGMFLKYVVPAGATQLELVCFGGNGGNNRGLGFSYGKINVTAGTSLALITGAESYSGAYAAANYAAYQQILANYGQSHPQFSGTNYARYGFGTGGTLAGVFELFNPTTTTFAQLRGKAIVIAGGSGGGGNAGGSCGGSGGGASGTQGDNVRGTSGGTGGTQSGAGGGWMNGFEMIGGPGAPNGDMEGGCGGAGYWAGGGGGNRSGGGGGSGYVGGSASYPVTGGYTQNGIPGAPGPVASANCTAAITAYSTNPNSGYYGVVYVYVS